MSDLQSGALTRKGTGVGTIERRRLTSYFAPHKSKRASLGNYSGFFVACKFWARTRRLDEAAPALFPNPFALGSARMEFDRQFGSMWVGWGASERPGMRVGLAALFVVDPVAPIDGNWRARA